MASLYAVTVPLFIRQLGNLDHILGKAIESGIDEQGLIEARLIGDMLPFPRQVQFASDAARFTAVRVGQAEPLAMADEETTLAQLRERIARTIAYLEKVDPAGFEGREEAEVMLKVGDREIPFKGLDYVTGFALPNFFFHVTTAHDILRHNGVKVGKRDYLGWKS